MRLRRVAQKLEVHVLRREKLPQLAPEGIVTNLADQSRRGAELCRGNSLIGALAAGEKTCATCAPIQRRFQALIMATAIDRSISSFSEN